MNNSLPLPRKQLPVVMATEYLANSRVYKFVQLFQTKVFLHIEIEFFLQGFLHKPGNMLEDDDVSDSSLPGSFQLCLQPVFVIFVQLRDVGRILVELRVEDKEATPVFVEGKVVISERLFVIFNGFFGW